CPTCPAWVVGGIRRGGARVHPRAAAGLFRLGGVTRNAGGASPRSFPLPARAERHDRAGQRDPRDGSRSRGHAVAVQGGRGRRLPRGGIALLRRYANSRLLRGALQPPDEEASADENVLHPRLPALVAASCPLRPGGNREELEMSFEVVTWNILATA